MLDTEIGKTGEVTVEGHVIGRLDGFMFAPDASGAASDAKALNAAAQKALAGEIEARATKLSQASNDQLLLANDGALRWTGDLVGKLIAGDDVLRPRVRIVADEHLTGPAKELVQTRLDLWLKTHIEKLLAPLFSLAAADDVTGMARGIAFQLVESLGVLERQKVAEEVKGLDQPARATLRKYGVRFGAYHIYLPILLKPAPRSLATQLWALKHESPDAKGVTELLHLAASGRTSIPVDKDTPKPLYRTAGYRICGERAVRVDILERLADLIRPILSWREAAPGPKPDGVFDGRGFTVTGAMTSLTGASGEDFASILRSLGYRMDRKPKPAETKPAEPVAGIEAETPPIETPPIETPQVETPHIESPPIEVASEAPPIEIVAVEAVAAEAIEPAMIEVWRPAGRHENRPPRPRRQPRPQKAAAPAPVQNGESASPAAADVSPAHVLAETPQQHRKGPDRDQRRERNERQKRVENQSQRFERRDNAQKRDRPPRRDKGNQVDRAERDQYYAKPFGGSENRNKQADPNSPFAKLAALKQQLEQSTKES
jgi:ATP-dependent RNA helicase SUPV3L1/SUV3